LTIVIDRGGVRLIFHSKHRPLHAYIQALAAADLLTETIREVGPPAQVIARDSAAQRWQRTPVLAPAGQSSHEMVYGRWFALPDWPA